MVSTTLLAAGGEKEFEHGRAILLNVTENLNVIRVVAGMSIATCQT